MPNSTDLPVIDLSGALKKAMQEKGLSFREVAKVLELSVGGCKKMIDRGDPDVIQLGKLNRLFGVNFFELYVPNTDAADLKVALAKVAELELHLSSALSRVERLEGENAIYRDTMAVLRKR